MTPLTSIVISGIQHKAARLVTRIPLREHITPVLKQLHWLPVECLITYKLMVLVYKCVNGTAPANLCRLIQPKCRDSRLRQPSDLELHRPVPKKAIGTAAFGFVRPDRWNKLPGRLRESASLNIFKRDFKGARYIIQILCRRYTFWSYPAGLTIADPPG